MSEKALAAAGAPVERAEVDAVVLWQLAEQARRGEGQKGYGRLLGYYRSEEGALCVQGSFPWSPLRGDRRGRAETTEEELRERLESYALPYRAVGAYLISDDREHYTAATLGALLHAERVPYPHFLLWVSPARLRLGRNPFQCLVPNPAFGTAPAAGQGSPAMFLEVELRVMPNPAIGLAMDSCTAEAAQSRPKSIDLSNAFFDSLEDALAQNTAQLGRVLSGKKGERARGEAAFQSSLQRCEKLIEDKRAQIAHYKKSLEMLEAMEKA